MWCILMALRATYFLSVIYGDPVGAFKKDPNERPSLRTVKLDVGSLTAQVPSGAE